MKANIYLYEDCRLTMSNNFTCDNVESHLATLAYNVGEYNFQKLDYSMSIKTTLNQSEIRPKKYNYAKVVQDGKPYYYYVSSIEWISESAVRCEVIMDTITTHWKDVEGSISDRTQVIREHRDRVVYDSYQPQLDKPYKLKRVIDRIGEEMQPTLNTNEDLKVPIAAPIYGKTYLMYKNRTLTVQDTTDPIQCFLIPEKPILIAAGSGSAAQDWTGDNLEDGIFYYFTLEDNYQTFSCTIYGGVSPLPVEFEGSTPLDGDNLLILEKRGSNIFYTVYRNIDGISTFVRDGITNRIEFTNTRAYRRGGTRTNSLAIINYLVAIVFPSGQVDAIYSGDIADVDRTDSKIIKLIELPYSPVPFDEESKKFEGFTFQQDGGFFLLDDLNIQFLNDEVGVIGDLDKIKYTYIQRLTPRTSKTITTIQNGAIEGLESKFANSEFYHTKAIYDSFNKVIKFENFRDIPFEVPVTFKMTSTINSNFAFKFDLDQVYEQEDFNDYLLVKRNNEIPLYNSEYINYVRNGYNYDRKAQTISNVMGLVGAGVNMATTGLSLGAGFAGKVRPISTQWMIHGTGPKYQKGPPLDLSTVQALGQAGSTATGLMGTIAGIIQGEQNLKRTLQEANAQAISVEGSDDIDLLNYYNFDNKLFYTRYYISDRLQSEVDKLFYYAGYATNQTKIPNLNTRVNFNFIQMDLKLKQDKLNSDVDEDIKARLQIGVTFHHEYNGTYDFDQECENLERAVWEEIN